VSTVLDKNTVMLELKGGSEIVGDVLMGYTMRGGKYHGWTVRADTLMKWLKQGLVIREPDAISNYAHFRWVG